MNMNDDEKQFLVEDDSHQQEDKMDKSEKTERSARYQNANVYKQAYKILDMMSAMVNSKKRQYCDQDHLKQWNETTEKFGRSAYGPKYKLKKDLSEKEIQDLLQFFKAMAPQFSSVAKLVIRDIPEDTKSGKKVKIDIFDLMGVDKKKPNNKKENLGYDPNNVQSPPKKKRGRPKKIKEETDK